jgi:hypothetical protein
LKEAAVAGASEPSPPAVGAEVAGLLLAAGYLTGVASGNLFLVAGAFALITAGRWIASGSRDAAPVGAAFVLIVCSLGAAALRWGTVDFSDWRGIQAVVGSPLVVEPVRVAVGAGLAAGGGLLALILWSVHPPVGRPRLALLFLEVGVIALALTTAFWGPGITPGEGAAKLALEAARWTGITLGVALVGLVGGRFLARHGSALRWVLAGGALAAVVAGTALVAGGI